MLTSDELIITSHSIDGTFESCPRRFEFLHVWLKAPDFERDTYPADVGTALHEASQEWIRSLWHGASIETADKNSTFTLLKWWPWEQEQKRLEDKRTLGNRTLGTALLMLQAITESMVWKDWELVEIEGFGPAIEVPYRIIYKSLGQIPIGVRGGQVLGYIASQGKIDFILRHRLTGRYAIWDLKTTEKAIPSHKAAFRFSGQGPNYGLVLQHALGLDWSKEGLDVTYLIAHFGLHENTVYPLHYNYTGEEIEDQIIATSDRLNRMKQYALSGYWPRRQHGCEFYGTPCGFLDICQRRDVDFVKRWMDFDIASGRFKQYERVYEPVWTLEA